MSADIQVILIAAIFGSQIVVLSFFMPRRSRQYYALMFKRYPPEEYPRLYPVPREQTQRRLALFMRLHLAIAAIAAFTLVASLIHGTNAAELVRRMFCCLLVQILPAYISLFWAIKMARALRAMPPPSVRSTELRQWRAVDFVSPLWISLGILGQILALTCAAIAYLQRREMLALVLFCSVISAALLWRMIYVLLGRTAFRRADPYMTTTDIFRIRQRRLRSLFRAGAAIGAVYAFLLLYQAHLIRMDYGVIYILVALSVMFQLLWYGLVSAQGRELETRDFSVYRADGPPHVDSPAIGTN